MKTIALALGLLVMGCQAQPVRAAAGRVVMIDSTLVCFDSRAEYEATAGRIRSGFWATVHDGAYIVRFVRTGTRLDSIIQVPAGNWCVSESVPLEDLETMDVNALR